MIQIKRKKKLKCWVLGFGFGFQKFFWPFIIFLRPLMLKKSSGMQESYMWVVFHPYKIANQNFHSSSLCCPGIFAPALVLGQRDTGTRKFLCPGTKGQRDVPSRGNPNIMSVWFWNFFNSGSEKASFLVKSLKYSKEIIVSSVYVRNILWFPYSMLILARNLAFYDPSSKKFYYQTT